MRHGQPAMAASKRVSAADMEDWINGYNRAEIADQPVPATSLQLAATATVIVSSTAPRALSSLRALGLEPRHVDALFGEAHLPYGQWKLPRLSPFTWAFILRVLWLCGYSRNGETISAARLRASMAAQRLLSLAREGPVLLLGHGLMNRMIAKELMAKGWSRRSRNGSHYWGAVVLAKRIEDPN